MRVVFNVFLILVLAMGFQACGDDNNDDNGGDGSGLVLSSDRDTISVNPADKATFTVMYNGKDVTRVSVITNEQEGVQIKNGTFASTKAKSYTFFAEYNGLVSNKVQVEVVSVNERLFQKNVLMLQITSTTCSACPNNRKIMDMFQEMRPTILFPMGFHGTMNATSEDPWKFPRIMDMMRELPVDGFGAIVFDYKYKLTGELDDLRHCMKARGDVGIALGTTLQAEQRTATIDVKIKSMIDVTSDCQLAVAIIEDNLPAPQVNTNGWDKDYVHNDVVRAYLTDLFGDRVAAGTITKTAEWTKKFSYTIPADYKVEDLMVMVYLLKDKQVVNCQGVKLGSSVGYQVVNYDLNEEPLPELEE